MHYQRFQGLRPFRGAEFQDAVMTQEDMAQLHGQLGGEIRPGRYLAIEHLHSQDDMADEAPLVGIVDQPVIGILVDLADVVEDAACHEEIVIEAFVMAAEPVQDPHHREGVLQQPADIDVMKALGGGGALEQTGDLFIPQEIPQQVPQGRRRHHRGKVLQVRIHPVGMHPGHGEIVRGIDLSGCRHAGVQDGQLDGVLILEGPGLDINEIALPESLFQFGDIVPDLAVHLARFILEAQVQIGRSLLGIGQIFFRDEKEVVDLLPRFDIPHIDALFHVSPIRSGCV